MDIKQQTQIRELLEKGKLKEALDELNSSSPNQSQLKDQISSLKSRFYRIKEHEFDGTLSSQEILLEKNRINKSILELLEYKIDPQKSSVKKSNLGKKVLIAIFCGLIALFVFWFFFNYQEKVITGKVYSSEEGKPIKDCTVIIVNLLSNTSAQTDANGNFYIHAKGKKIQDVEFRFIHQDYEPKSEEVSISFRKFDDTLFTRQFDLIPK